MSKLSIRDLDFEGQPLFMRVDFNVPIGKGQVTDATRIRSTLPSIQYAREHGAKLVLGSHLGRPDGQRNPKYSLQPVAAKLGELLEAPVRFTNDCVGTEVIHTVKSLPVGGVLLLENLRFHGEEEKNDEAFARKLADLASLYVNDAFGTAHRAHASTEGITHFVKKAAAGLLMERELEYLGKVLHDPDRPLVVILGGAKVSDKMGVIDNLLKIADAVLVGGAMAYTFLKSQGYGVGASLVEDDQLELARNLLESAKARGIEFVLPIDHVITDKSSGSIDPSVVATEAIAPAAAGRDIGPATAAKFSDIISRARMVVWNGPMGVFEQKPFDQGTLAVARAVAGCAGITIVGGGDSVAAVHQAGVAGQLTHISTGGGATLEFLAGEQLPGVRALTEKEKVEPE